MGDTVSDALYFKLFSFVMGFYCISLKEDPKTTDGNM